ncbi:MAG: hypothetical protein EPN82_04915 [Bacteroidetes bacterium]|nr:MAG: hypothetical protein EPN82_04915 [Bacteroidota bacterium]
MKKFYVLLMILFMATSSYVISNDLDSLKKVIEKINLDHEKLKDKVESQSKNMEILFYVLVGVLSIGGLTSLVGWFRNETRTQREHNLSKNTIDMVNEILNLTVGANKKALESKSNWLNLTSEDLTRRASELIDKSKDKNVLINNNESIYEISKISEEIPVLKNNIKVWGENIEISLKCLFIRALDLHINQKFDAAIETWKEVYESKHSDIDDLKKEAHYWTGCEYNNLGEYEKALEQFDFALEIVKNAKDIEKFEIERIILETRFFNKDNDNEENILEGFSELYEKISKSNEHGIDDLKSKIANSYANIYFSKGFNLQKKAKDDEARKYYEETKKYYQIGSNNYFSKLNLAETNYRLGKENIKEDFIDIKNRAKIRYLNKKEPRTKVSECAINFIFALRLQENIQEIEKKYKDVIRDIYSVNDRLTIYSPIRKLNVDRGEFENDIDFLLKEHNDNKVILKNVRT